MQFSILSLCQQEHQSLVEEVRINHPDWDVFCTTRQEEAIGLLRQKKPNVVLVDFTLSEIRPLQLARVLLAEQQDLSLIGLIQGMSVNAAITPIRQGFHDLIDLGEEPGLKLERELAALAKQQETKQRGSVLDKHQRESSTLVGQSLALKAVLDVVAKVSRHKWVTVLIRGETGTGKELIARKLHYDSSTSAQPFVEINCSTIPENLLEAELFGYERGAYTDAKTRKKGLFEFAENGTLFLDEIGTIGPAFQAKLLKAIEEKTIRRLGGTEDIRVNSRIIAATNRDLHAAIEEKQFRQDLYYRLNVVSVQLPPLRDRGDDVILLARHFLSRFAREYDSSLAGFSSEATGLLTSYRWPGNVRELKHTIERLALLADGDTVTRAALEEAIESDTPIVLAGEKGPTSVTIDVPVDGLSLDEAQRQFIERVFEKTGYHKRRTCEALKISRPRLDRILKKYGISVRRLRSM